MSLSWFLSYVTKIENEIRSTVGIDRDLWCYAKNMDSENGTQYTAIAFYAWDFAGEVSCYVNFM